MGDRLEARISAMENIQEEFGHDIREMKEQLARLTSLFKDHIRSEAMHPRGPSPLPPQWIPRSFVQTTGYLPRKTDRSDLRQPRPTASHAFRTTPRPTDLPSSSRGKPNGQKFEKDKPRWDPIPVTYTELFPKLMKLGHIKPLQLAPLRPPFPRWYNAHTQCDYHGGNPGHSTENCIALKHKVQDLINDGKLKFDDFGRPAEVEDPSRTKVEVPGQKEETPKEANLEEATTPKEKVPIAKTDSSSTTEKLEERSCEPSTNEEEKKVLQEIAQGLERMSVKQNEFVTTLKEEHHSRTLKRRRTLESDEA